MPQLYRSKDRFLSAEGAKAEDRAADRRMVKLSVELKLFAITQRVNTPTKARNF